MSSSSNGGGFFSFSRSSSISAGILMTTTTRARPSSEFSSLRNRLQIVLSFLGLLRYTRQEGTQDRKAHGIHQVRRKDPILTACSGRPSAQCQLFHCVQGPRQLRSALPSESAPSRNPEHNGKLNIVSIIIILSHFRVFVNSHFIMTFRSTTGRLVDKKLAQM